MDILQKISNHKITEVDQRRKITPIEALEKSDYFGRASVSLSQHILRPDQTGVIAEFKKKSPSEGFINRNADVRLITRGYIDAGSSALSILTDAPFFGGSTEDLQLARTVNECPILRKDFIVDEYQIYEAKAIGADAILLIAEILSKIQIKSFTALAHQLNMEVLMEIHSEVQLEKFIDEIDVLGVNNRNLKNFEVSISHSVDMYDQLPANVVKISESGIHHVEEMIELAEVGYDGFLIGTQFMRTKDPVQACKALLENYRAQYQSK